MSCDIKLAIENVNIFNDDQESSEEETETSRKRFFTPGDVITRYETIRKLSYY